MTRPEKAVSLGPFIEHGLAHASSAVLKEIMRRSRKSSRFLLKFELLHSPKFRLLIWRCIARIIAVRWPSLMWKVCLSLRMTAKRSFAMKKEAYAWRSCSWDSEYRKPRYKAVLGITCSIWQAYPRKHGKHGCECCKISFPYAKQACR